MVSASLSARQLELFKAVIEVTNYNVDWTEVAAKADFKTSKYARDTWAGIKAKLLVANVPATSLSARQLDLIKAYIELMQGTTDWTAVAKKANFKMSKYARDSWTAVKNKFVGLQTDATSTDGQKETTPAEDDDTTEKPKKATKARKRKNKSGDSEEPAMKSKKRKETPVKTVKAEVENDDGSADGEDAAVTHKTERGKATTGATTPGADEGAAEERDAVEAEVKSGADHDAAEDTAEGEKPVVEAEVEPDVASDDGLDAFTMF